MKKIELHVHLDGSVRPSTVSEILNLDLDYVKKNMVVESNNEDLSCYLTKFDLPVRAMQTKDNLKRIAKELAIDLKNDDVIYAETRFAPQKHTLNGLSLNDVVLSVLEGLKSVNGIKINLILCMMRGDSFDKNKEVIDVCEKYLGNGVVALDLAGDEKHFKTKDYKALFDIAKEKKVPFTIHAGEADNYRSVKDAISFGAKRIGHGINIIENDDVIKDVIKNKITLEICPTSNLQTKAVKSYEDHPIKKLYEKGVLITINTDNNTVSNTTLSKEYELLKKYFDFGKKEFYEFNKNAIYASFMTDKEKEELIDKLKEDFDKI
jgi:adenosine deaminase